MVVLKIAKIEQLIVGAILTGIAVVIGRSWGDLIQAIVTEIMKRLKCRGKKGRDLTQCRQTQDAKSRYDPLVMTLNAVCTTLILILIMVPLWRYGFTIDKNKIS